MTLQQLDNFIAVVEAQSFSAASERIFLSRQALSHSIKQLEDSLGCRLIVADNKNVEITPAGELLYARGKGLIAELKELEKSILRETCEKKPLKIVLANMLHPLLEPELLKQLDGFMAEFPDAVLSIDDCDNSQVLDRVRGGTDIGFLIGDIDERLFEGLEYKVYRSEKLCCTMPKSDPLAKKNSLSIKDLDGRTFSVPAEPETYLKGFFAECKEENANINYVILSSYSAATHYGEIQPDCLFCDIPWDEFSIKYTTKSFSGSNALLNFYIVTRPGEENYNKKLFLDRLRKRGFDF